MTYSEFEIRLLLALVEGAEASDRGQCNATLVAETVLPHAEEQWVSDAVQVYERRRLLARSSDLLMDQSYWR